MVAATISTADSYGVSTASGEMCREMSMAVNAIARVGTNLTEETTLMSNDGGVGQGRTNDAEGGRSANRVNGQRREVLTASGEGHGKCQRRWV